MSSPSTLLAQPRSRHVDPRGQRFGAGMSVLLLAAAFGLDLPWLAVVIGLNLLIAAAFGTRLFLPGRAWPLIRRALRLAPVEPEHEYPPRFAQAMGGSVLALGAIAFLVGWPVVGWLAVAAVAALQLLLAATGICIGCRLYVLRWFLPALAARLFRRADDLRPLDVPALRRLG